MNAFFYPSKRGINFAKIRGFKFTDYTLLRHSKSVGPSAPIAYATSVSPPDEAVAWQGCRCWMQDEAVISNFESPNFRKVNSPF